MPHEISWYLDKRIILIRYTGILTSEELKVAIPKSMSKMDQGIPPLYMMIDVSKVEKFPVNLAELKRFTETKHPSVSWIAMIGMNPMARFIMAALSQVANLKVRATNSVEEAVAFFSQLDNTLREGLPEQQKDNL